MPARYRRKSRGGLFATDIGVGSKAAASMDDTRPPWLTGRRSRLQGYSPPWLTYHPDEGR